MGYNPDVRAPFQSGVPYNSYQSSMPTAQAQAYQNPSIQPAYTPNQPVTQYIRDRSQPQSFIYGRVVQDINQVYPNEVPNDGSPAFFPLSDKTAVYVKMWGNDGRIITLKYAIDNGEENETSASTPTNQEIMNKLNEIEQKLHYNKPFKKQHKPNTELIKKEET